MIRAVLFDVNETLLDMRSLDPYFAHLFGHAAAREPWFQQLENVWLTTIAINHYESFDKLAEAALLMEAAKHGIIPSVRDRCGLSQSLNRMPPHADVRSGVNKLHEAEFRVAALTNGTHKTLEQQMKYARLEECFELLLSADEVRRYKPAPEPYHLACRRLALNPSDVLLVTCHAWDIAGGSSAGMKTAFIRRERKTFNPLDPKADLECDNVSSLAERLCASRSQERHSSGLS